MSKIYKSEWLLLNILTAIIFLSTVAFFIVSHGTEIELNLIEGEKINVKLFRILPHNLASTLIFTRVKGEERPELGEFKTIGDWRETGVLEFVNPGQPIKLVVSDSLQKVVYEAMPTSGYTSRDLVRYQEGHNPFKFSWPPYDGKRFLLHSGFNEFQITVIEVGKSFVGEKVTLYFSPPLGFKHASKGLFYQYLWFFYAWPVYVFILFVFYILFISQKRRVHKDISH